MIFMLNTCAICSFEKFEKFESVCLFEGEASISAKAKVQSRSKNRAGGNGVIRANSQFNSC